MERTEVTSIRSDGYTVVMLSPKFIRKQRTYPEYWARKAHKRFYARWLQALAGKIMAKWGQQYQESYAIKTYPPIDLDAEGIGKSIMRQINSWARMINVSELVILAGEPQYEELMHSTEAQLGDICMGERDDRGNSIVRTWRGFRVTIIPDMRGAIVLPRRILQDAVKINPTAENNFYKKDL